ncbi:MAG: sulfatase-like hydrolase/transferase [Schwartzia sp.]|nr:sulfatase-like hydrolase/transferase [Schwartzia sp. (in: firmicutes)]
MIIDDAARAREIFFSLVARAERGDYGRDYLDEVREFRRLRPESEQPDIFRARYELARKNYIKAIEYGRRAQLVRRVNREVWDVLAAAYRGLNRPLDAIIYEGFLDKFYKVPIKLDMMRGLLDEAMERLTAAMGSGTYPHILRREMIMKDDAGITDNPAVAVGRYLTLLDDIGGSESRKKYWVGVFTQQGDMNVDGDLAERNRNDDRFANDAGAGMRFDLMRAEETRETTVIPDGECVVAIAGTGREQKIDFSAGTLDDSAWAGKNSFSFYRINEPTHIKSDGTFIISDPVRLGHSANRKRLVLNILIDAVPWKRIRSKCHELMPNIMKFFEKGIIFDNHFSVAEYTYPSLATIETGLFEHRTGIFNDSDSQPMPRGVVTLSERMKMLGYHTVNVMGDGGGVVSGATRGYDRLIISSYSSPMWEGVERTINELEAFGEADEFILLHAGDAHPWNAHTYCVPMATQTRMPLSERLLRHVARKNSVYLPHTPLYMNWVEQGIRDADRALGMLFDYLQSHYNDDDYVVHLYSDHGVPVFDRHPGILSDGQTGAMFMVRGGLGGGRGIAEELTSAVDIYPTVLHNVGAAIPGDIDGRLPRAFRGDGREYTLSESIYPGQTTKMAFRTREYECQVEAREKTDEDGTADFTDYRMAIFSRDGRRGPDVFGGAADDEALAGMSPEDYNWAQYAIGREKISEEEHPEVWEYFRGLLREHVRSFDTEGRHFPDMKNERPGWFK